MYLILRSVVDCVLKPLLFGDTQFPSDMERILSKYNEDVYKFKAVHGDKFDSTIGYAAFRMSFRTASRSVKVARNYGHLSNFHSISEGMVRQFVQANDSINLEHIRKLV